MLDLKNEEKRQLDIFFSKEVQFKRHLGNMDINGKYSKTA